MFICLFYSDFEKFEKDKKIFLSVLSLLLVIECQYKILLLNNKARKKYAKEENRQKDVFLSCDKSKLSVHSS